MDASIVGFTRTLFKFFILTIQKCLVNVKIVVTVATTGKKCCRQKNVLYCQLPMYYQLRLHIPLNGFSLCFKGIFFEGWGVSKDLSEARKTSKF